MERTIIVRFASGTNWCTGRPIRNLPSQIDISSDATIKDIYHHLAHCLKCSVHRIRLTRFPSVKSYLEAGSTETLKEWHAPDGEQIRLYVRDLGPQIEWRTVYLLEYLGPLILHPLLFAIFTATTNPSPSLGQKLVCVAVTIHYLKRELETIFLHQFSAATMPLGNLFKNSFHYWILGGVNLAFWSYSRPLLINSVISNNTAVVGIAVWLFGEIWNFDVHLYLRLQRGERNSKTRVIPRGHGFGLVTCPNYLAEIISWLGVWVISGYGWAAALFAFVSAWQMLLWARKRECKYRTQFGESYIKKRWSMIPGLP